MSRLWAVTIRLEIVEHGEQASAGATEAPASAPRVDPPKEPRRYQYDLNGGSFVKITCRDCGVPRITRPCSAVPSSASYTERCERCAGERARKLNTARVRRHREKQRMTG
jgi:hypothetical protein